MVINKKSYLLLLLFVSSKQRVLVFCKQGVKYTTTGFLGIYSESNLSHKALPLECEMKSEALKMDKLWNFGNEKHDLLNAWRRWTAACASRIWSLR